MTLRVAVIGLGPIGNRHADMYSSDALAELEQGLLALTAEHA